MNPDRVDPDDRAALASLDGPDPRDDPRAVPQRCVVIVPIAPKLFRTCDRETDIALTATVVPGVEIGYFVCAEHWDTIAQNAAAEQQGRDE